MLPASDNNLIASLDSIVDEALAVTVGPTAASHIDEDEVIRRAEAALREAVSRPDALLEVLDRLEAKLKERLKSVPDEIERAAFDHRVDTFKWRRDPPMMPRAITAFVVLDRLRSARSRCIYEQAKARYK